MINVEPETQAIHEEVLYPMARVIADRSGGSGTILYSRKDPKSKFDEYETYVLTNYHVVSGLVKVETRFDPALGRDKKVQVTQKAQVDIFRYRFWSVKDRDYSIDADIVAWDKNRDLALLKLDSTEEVDFVASLYEVSRLDIQSKKMPEVYVADRIAVVGAALLNPPVFTEGRIARMFEEIDNYPYLLSTAPTIFGNSGGAVYRIGKDGHWKMIGVPARISVTQSGFSWNAITHLSWSIPIFTVYEFLHNNYFDWVFDPSQSKDSCLKRRAKDRRRHEIDAVLSAQEGPEKIGPGMMKTDKD